MTWIREDELQGQEVLDEVEVWDMLYVKVADNELSSQSKAIPPITENTERRDSYGLHAGVKL